LQIKQSSESTHLYVHHDQQTGLRQQSEGLVVGDVLAVVSHRVVHGGPRDEEEDEGAVAAVHQAAHKGLLAEVQVQLARGVELWVLETPAVVHILGGIGRIGSDGGEEREGERGRERERREP